MASITATRDARAPRRVEHLVAHPARRHFETAAWFHHLVQQRSLLSGTPRNAVCRRVLTVALFGLGLAACGADGDVRAGDAQGLRPTQPITTTTAPSTTTSAVSTTTSAPRTTVVGPTSTGAPAATTTLAELDCVDPSALPLIASADDDGYDTVQVQEGLGAPDDREVALFTGGGAVAVQQGSGQNRSIEYRIGPADGIGPSGTIENATLYDLVVTASGPKVLYGEIYQGDGEPTGDVKLLDIGSGDTATITTSQGPEYFVYAASVADGIVVTSAVADLSESIATWKLDGSGALDRFTPVRPEDYGLAPFFGPAVPSPDGKRLAWLEGPDVEGASSERTGDWQLVVADAVTGVEELRLFLAPADDDFIWLSWDGDWAVLSRGHGLDAAAVHTADEEPTLRPLCATEARTSLLNGTVTIVKQNAVSADPRVALHA